MDPGFQQGEGYIDNLSLWINADHGHTGRMHCTRSSIIIWILVSWAALQPCENGWPWLLEMLAWTNCYYEIDRCLVTSPDDIGLMALSYQMDG